MAQRLKTYDLRKLGSIRKLSKPHRIIPSAQSPYQKESFVKLEENP